MALTCYAVGVRPSGISTEAESFRLHGVLAGAESPLHDHCAKTAVPLGKSAKHRQSKAGEASRRHGTTSQPPIDRRSCVTSVTGSPLQGSAKSADTVTKMQRVLSDGVLQRARVIQVRSRWSGMGSHDSLLPGEVPNTSSGDGESKRMLQKGGIGWCGGSLIQRDEHLCLYAQVLSHCWWLG